MKYIFALIIGLSPALFNSSAFAQASCKTGKPADDMPPEFSQLAFIIGDFDVTLRTKTEDGWSEPVGAARWNGRYSLDGRAIMDWWYEDNNAGVNIRTFDTERGFWKSSWHSATSNEIREMRLRVFDEDNKLHLWQIYPKGANRNDYFETYEDGRWERIMQRYDQDEKEWKPVAKLEATPAKCKTRH